MGSLDPNAAMSLDLKSFSLTHILYNPSHPKYLSIPLTLLSLSPIFLFVSYFTLLVFNRQLTVLFLAAGSLINEVLSWVLKRVLKGQRPYFGHEHIGHGYGMPSSHSQAAGYLAAWGIAYALTQDKRMSMSTAPRISGVEPIRKARTGAYLVGLVVWSLLTAYSRWYLLYHSPIQIVAGYLFGVAYGLIHFSLTEFMPLYHPTSVVGKLRRGIEWLWVGVGGVGGWRIGGQPGGWGEGHLLLSNPPPASLKPGSQAKSSEKSQ